MTMRVLAAPVHRCVSTYPDRSSVPAALVMCWAEMEDHVLVCQIKVIGVSKLLKKYNTSNAMGMYYVILILTWFFYNKITVAICSVIIPNWLTHQKVVTANFSETKQLSGTNTIWHSWNNSSWQNLVTCPFGLSNSFEHSNHTYFVLCKLVILWWKCTLKVLKGLMQKCSYMHPSYTHEV